jgi:hypothetical protein
LNSKISGPKLEQFVLYDDDKITKEDRFKRNIKAYMNFYEKKGEIDEKMPKVQGNPEIHPFALPPV